MKYFLVKSEPFKYSWNQLLADGSTFWDGVRNYQARNVLKTMNTGDLVLYYHSNEGLAIVGMARVIREAYQDPTTDDVRWVAVDIEPVETFVTPVNLQEIRNDEALKGMLLIKQSRLSVMPVTDQEFARILQIGRQNG
jgi:predicted RNA-binding protein with PUA-like domain